MNFIRPDAGLLSGASTVAPCTNSPAVFAADTVMWLLSGLLVLPASPKKSRGDHVAPSSYDTSTVPYCGSSLLKLESNSSVTVPGVMPERSIAFVTRKLLNRPGAWLTSSHSSESATITPPLPSVKRLRSWSPAVITHEFLSITVQPWKSEPLAGISELSTVNPAGRARVKSVPSPLGSVTNGPSGSRSNVSVSRIALLVSVLLMSRNAPSSISTE